MQHPTIFDSLLVPGGSYCDDLFSLKVISAQFFNQSIFNHFNRYFKVVRILVASAYLCFF